MGIGVAMQGNLFGCEPDGQAAGIAVPMPASAGVDSGLPQDPLLALERFLVGHLRGVVTRDEQALAALYDATSGRVYALALRITGRADTAEEVAADVYMQVWRDASRYDLARGRVLTWLLTICRSRAIDAMRRRDPAEPCAEPDQLVACHDGGAGSPEALMLLAERNDTIRKAVESLDPVQRQLLSLAFFRGLTHEEIAAHTALPLGSVKTHIRKALQHLHAGLASFLPAEWR